MEPSPPAAPLGPECVTATPERDLSAFLHQQLIILCNSFILVFIFLFLLFALMFMFSVVQKLDILNYMQSKLGSNWLHLLQ